MTLISAFISNFLPINANQTTNTVKLQTIADKTTVAIPSDLGYANKDLVQSVMTTLQNMSLDTASIDNSSNSNITDASSSNTTVLLHKFLHDLYQALTKGTDQTITQSNQLVQSDNDSDNDTLEAKTATQPAYNSSPATHLQNLITSLDNNTSNNVSHVLKNDFANLTQSLASSSANTSASSANLQNFLKQLATTMGDPNVLQSSVGNLFFAVA